MLRGGSRIFQKGCLKFFFLVNERSELASEKRVALITSMSQLGGELFAPQWEIWDFYVLKPQNTSLWHHLHDIRNTRKLIVREIKSAWNLCKTLPAELNPLENFIKKCQDFRNSYSLEIFWNTFLSLVFFLTTLNIWLITLKYCKHHHPQN